MRILKIFDIVGWRPSYHERGRRLNQPRRMWMKAGTGRPWLAAVVTASRGADGPRQFILALEFWPGFL
jgi:hypothetical protein